MYVMMDLLEKFTAKYSEQIEENTKLRLLHSEKQEENVKLHFEFFLINQNMNKNNKSIINLKYNLMKRIKLLKW
jgi:hypothetical protein